MKTKLEAHGEFPFTFYIEKATPVEENGKLIVEGIASTINVDHDNERMAGDALESMARIINQDSVPLRLEHSKDDNAVIGSVYKAWVDERNQMWIRAAIDPAHPSGPMLHDSLKQGAKFGLSVGGRVKNAIRELVESTGKYVKTFYDVVLDEVSVTRKPANYDAWLFAKSIKGKDADVSPFYDSPLYSQFMFENPKLDYMQQFAKSIPDGSWKKVDNKLEDNNNKSMDDKDKKPVDATKEGDDKKAPMPADTEKEGEDQKKPDEATKSFVTKSEFSKAMAIVNKGFAAVMKALETPPMQTTNPDKTKAPVETQQVAKEGDADGGEVKRNVDQPAMDTNNPDKAKPQAETQQTAKDGEDKKEDEATKDGEGDKKPDDMDKDGEEDKKPDETMKDGEDKKDDEAMKEGDDDKKPDDMAKDGDEPKSDEYKLKSMSQAIARIASISKRSKGEKVTKSASNLSSIDTFAVTVAEALDALNERFEKSGIRVPGLTGQFIDMLRTDKGLQEEVRKMMKEPGVKKSVAMGIPYMVTREGKKYSLSANAVGDSVQKSKKNDGKTFKEVFQSDFSSFPKNE